MSKFEIEAEHVEEGAARLVAEAILARRGCSDAIFDAVVRKMAQRLESEATKIEDDALEKFKTRADTLVDERGKKLAERLSKALEADFDKITRRVRLFAEERASNLERFAGKNAVRDALRFAMQKAHGDLIARLARESFTRFVAALGEKGEEG